MKLYRYCFSLIHKHPKQLESKSWKTLKKTNDPGTIFRENEIFGKTESPEISGLLFLTIQSVQDYVEVIRAFATTFILVCSYCISKFTAIFFRLVFTIIHYF